MAVRVGHHHPADVALPDADASRSEADEPVDLSSLVTAGRWSEVEVQPVLPGLRHQWRTAHVIFGPPRGEPSHASAPERPAIARQERDAVMGVVGQLPAQDAGPRLRKTERVVASKRSSQRRLIEPDR